MVRINNFKDKKINLKLIRLKIAIIEIISVLKESSINDL